MTGFSAKAIMWLSASALFLQSVPTTSSGDTFVGQAERLTLVGALVIAVGVLWRALGKKDDQVSESLKATTSALLSTAETNRELRHSIEAVLERERERER